MDKFEHFGLSVAVRLDLTSGFNKGIKATAKAKEDFNYT